jgi:serine phosphatase RsbU (regulator of sigma subunit)
MAPAGDEQRGSDFALIERHGQRTVLVVGDVEGHGSHVAKQAHVVSRLFSDRVPDVQDPCALLQSVNQGLLGRLGDRYATAVVATFDARDASLDWAFAAHVPPYSLDTGIPLDGATPGLPLGLDDELGCTSARRRPVAAGDGILLVTDGVEDVRGPNRERFGHDRVSHTLARLQGCPADAVAENLKSEVCSFGDGRLPDDICIVAVRFEAA